MKFIYFLIIVELVVGGGGRIFEIGPATLRIYLFLIALGCWVVYATNRGYLTASERASLKYTNIILLVLVFGSINGLVSGNRSSEILVDFRQLIYLFIFPFFASQINSKLRVDLTLRVILYSAFFVAFAYVFIFVALRFGLLDFNYIYWGAKDSGELIWRGTEYFFFKGFAYVGVGLIIGVCLKPKYWVLICVVMMLGVLLTLTRGLIFSSLLGVLVVLLAKRSYRIGSGVVIISIFVFIIFGEYMAELSGGLFDNRELSSEIRLDDLSFFMDNLGLDGLLIGKGLGTQISDRLLIEQTYMWVVWKFGVLGLLVCFYPLYANFIWFKSVRVDSSSYNLALGLFVSVLYMYVLSLFNPFVINSIGISCVIICSLGLRGLSGRERLQ